MKTALCTISANNFLPYGLDCLLSNKEFNDYDYYYLVADEFDETLYSEYTKDIKFIRLEEIGIDKRDLVELEFKYNIVEFNTCVKPAFYKYLFSLGYDNVIYLDPDIESYSKFTFLDDLLTKNNIVLTPHKCTAKKSTFFKDNDFLNNGIYNLGFIAMHKSEQTNEFLTWWDNALRDSCYVDYSNGMATDQIWANLAPVYFEGVFITKHPGMNLAFWNIDERVVLYLQPLEEVRVLTVARTSEPRISTSIVVVWTAVGKYTTFYLHVLNQLTIWTLEADESSGKTTELTVGNEQL